MNKTNEHARTEGSALRERIIKALDDLPPDALRLLWRHVLSIKRIYKREG